MSLDKDFELVKQGAEARIYRGLYLGKPTIAKERFKKMYRHSDLDYHITRERIKAEARSILRSKLAGVCTPAIYFVSLEKSCIYMEDIVNGITVKDFITEASRNEQGEKYERNSNLNFITGEIGKAVGKLHSNNIIHGDLTTSNMLVVDRNDLEKRHIVFIDFGLSFSEPSVEDKGVDLYVLERALNSTHSNAQLFPDILVSYAKEYKKGSIEVLKKLEAVRARGRKRTMVG